MIWLFNILFSATFHEFSSNKINLCVKIKKIIVAILKLRVKFNWSISVPRQHMYHTFGRILQVCANKKNVEPNFIPQ